MLVVAKSIKGRNVSLSEHPHLGYRKNDSVDVYYGVIDRPKPFVRLPLTGANIQFFTEIRVLDVNLVRADSHYKTYSLS